MTLREQSDGSATLGRDTDLLCLGRTQAPLRPMATAACFHFALLVPTRIDLARWLAHAAQRSGSLDGPSRPLRERGNLPRRSGWSRRRDLLGPPARGGTDGLLSE